MTAPPDIRATIVIVESSMSVTGALRCASRLARLLAPWARTILVLPRGSRVGPCELEDFVEVVRLPLVQVRKSLPALIAYLPALLVASLRLRGLLTRSGASALILNDFYLMHGSMVRAFGHRGTIATWVRFDPAKFPRLLSRLWLRAAYRSSDAVIAVSDFIVGRLPASPKLRRIYDTVDLDFAAPASHKPAGRDVLFVANYIAGKGQDDAIATFAAVAGRFPDVRLIFHGSDMGLDKNAKYLSELKQGAAASGAGERIVFRGFAQDLPSVMADAAVALVLSHSESFSLTCLEASQLGVPVIAYRSGGPAEIVEDGVTGCLCEVGDIEAVSRALAHLLGDPDHAARMGRAGSTRVRDKFGPAQFVEAARAALNL